MFFLTNISKPRAVIIVVLSLLALKVIYNESLVIFRSLKWNLQTIKVENLPDGSHYPNRYRPVAYQVYIDKGPPSMGKSGEKFLFKAGQGIHENAQNEAIVEILAVGDIIPHAEVQLTAYLHRNDSGEGSGGYDWIFRKVKDLISGADIAMANLETPISPSSQPSGYPFYNADPYLLDALKRAGFDVLFTANNHALDQGLIGLQETQDELLKRGFVYVGTSQTGGTGKEVEYIFLKNGRRTRSHQPGGRRHVIAYSLGNFISRQGGLCKYGMALRMNIARTNNGIQVQTVYPEMLETVSETNQISHNGYARSIKTFHVDRLK